MSGAQLSGSDLEAVAARHAARNVRGVRAGLWLLGDRARPGVSPYREGIVPPNWPVTCRKTWLHRLPGDRQCAQDYTI